MSEDTLQALLDEHAISQVMVQYCYAIDFQDREAFLDCFAPSVELEFPALIRPVPQRVSAEEWADQALADAAAFSATQHFTSNHRIQVTGDSATCRAYVLAQHYKPTETGSSHATLGAYWDCHFRRTAEGWRIWKYGVTIRWKTGNDGVYRAAAAAYLTN
jgi:hypothetical protein